MLSPDFVILTAVAPTLIAQTFFQPEVAGALVQEEIEAAEGIDAGPLRHPHSPARAGQLDDAEPGVRSAPRAGPARQTEPR